MKKVKKTCLIFQVSEIIIHSCYHGSAFGQSVHHYHYMIVTVLQSVNVSCILNNNMITIYEEIIIIYEEVIVIYEEVIIIYEEVVIIYEEVVIIYEEVIFTYEEGAEEDEGHEVRYGDVKATFVGTQSRDLIIACSSSHARQHDLL